jgi:hypothetical protein
MKKYILSALIGAVCSLLILFAVTTIRTNQNNRDADFDYTDFESDISIEECFICSDNDRSILSFYWGEDNVGIVNLNTLEILPIEINRYTDSKQLITEPAGYMQQSTIGDSEAYAYAAVFPDEGYADVRISGAGSGIDVRHVERSFCQNCLGSINTHNVDNKVPAVFAVISFSDRTILPLLETYSRFSSGNYGIDCDFEEDGEIDLLIHYCGSRYN